MSKFDKVKEQYPSVSNATLLKLYTEDWTASKKYFPYMVKLWDRKKMNGETFTSPLLIKTLKQFDSLLPYVSEKDVYSSKYDRFYNLQKEVLAAEVIKEEKTFVRDEHVTIIEETDKYLFLSPITHKGSVKYGFGTRWCTASKHDEYTFNRYNKTGYLAYLIFKNEDSKNNKFSKIAFYSEQSTCPFSGEILVYHALDDLATDVELLTSQFLDLESLFKLMTKFRQHAYGKFRLQKAESNVKRKLNLLQTFDFQQFQEDVTIIRDWQTRLYTGEFGQNVQELDSIIKSFVDEVTKQMQQNG